MCTRHLNIANKSETASKASSAKSISSTNSTKSTCSALTRNGKKCTLRATNGDKCGKHGPKETEKYSSEEELDESKEPPPSEESESESESELTKYNITEEELGKINKVFDKAMSLADKNGEIETFKKEFVLPKKHKRPTLLVDRIQKTKNES
jgi:hypothetical protein